MISAICKNYSTICSQNLLVLIQQEGKLFTNIYAIQTEALLIELPLQFLSKTTVKIQLSHGCL